MRSFLLLLVLLLSSSISYGAITENQFYSALEKVDSIYSPIVREKGAKLWTLYEWESNKVNAYANQVDNTWFISTFGGFARHEHMSSDAFLLALCHEVGHHLGGAPRAMKAVDTYYMAVEGQADYWAALKCMPRILESEPNETIVSSMNVSEFVRKSCSDSFKSKNKIAICIRTSMAAKALTYVFLDIHTPYTDVILDHTTPDTNIVPYLDEYHPFPQCRLDTYFNAALCNVDFKIDVSNENPMDGSCVDGVGQRPRCWYKE